MSKGNCFEVAARMVLDLVDQTDPEDRDDVERGLMVLNAIRQSADSVKLVHGVVERQTDKLLHLHAWVEVTINGKTICMDYANGRSFFLPIDKFYGGSVMLTTEYDVQKTREALAEHETWGPWHLSEPTEANKRREELRKEAHNVAR